MDRTKIALGHIVEFQDQHGFYVVIDFSSDKSNITFKNLNNLGGSLKIEWHIIEQLTFKIKGYAYNVENYR